MDERILYKRPRIDGMLAGIFSKPLTVVMATAGYGKTTAVREFLHHKHIDKIWVSITVNDEMFLWEKICAGVASFSSDAAAVLLSMSVPQDYLQNARIVEFLKRNLKRPMVLVLDDYHLLSQESRLNGLINTLAFDNIPDFHLILISRGTPNIKLYTLASKQLCNRLDTADLAFTRDETASYLAARGLRMASGAIDKIMEKTDGWVSAIYLIGEGIRHGMAIGDIRDISGLIRENLLDQLEEQQRQWLVRLSVFGSFSGSLAAAALDTAEIQNLLDSMIAENAFLSNDDGQYRFHPLLREVLLEGAADDEAQKDFYYRAGLWFENQGADRDAFDFFVRSGRIEEYFGRINRAGIRRIHSYSSGSLQQVAADLPEDTCLQYPFPYLQIIFFLMISGNAEYYETGRKMLGRMEEHFAGSAAPDANIIRGECLVIRRLTNLDPPEHWNNLLRGAVREFDGRFSSVISPEDPFTFGLPMLLHSEFLSAGTLDAAVERCRVNYFEKIAEGFGRGSESLILAEAAIARCRISDAKKDAWKAISQAQESCQYYVAASGRFVLMRACLFEGNVQEAEEQMEAIHSLSVQAAEHRVKSEIREIFANFIECCEGFLNISLGQIERIPAVFRSRYAMPQRMLGGMGVPLCLRTRTQLLMGNAAEAIGLSDALRQNAGSSACQFVRLSLKIQRAVAEAVLYPDRKDAEETLVGVLEEAKPDHVLLLFAEYAKPLFPLLKKVQKRKDVSTDFCQCVLDACQEALSYPVIQTSAADDIDLTEREKEIIRQVARGMARREIAANLFIQENTVKKHLSSIYRKLNVDNKVSAINSAKQLKII